ncbi:hypothetical protein M5K25_002478 [Dendrobium thyrsiflorum]|uniref:Uncharacterized protein n=1 Tax=Dendrobium thyrsiflorum TaxID=117978 RepID=A0ABD0VU64_DENTH
MSSQPNITLSFLPPQSLQPIILHFSPTTPSTSSTALASIQNRERQGKKRRKLNLNKHLTHITDLSPSLGILMITNIAREETVLCRLQVEAKGVTVLCRLQVEAKGVQIDQLVKRFEAFKTRFDTFEAQHQQFQTNMYAYMDQQQQQRAHDRAWFTEQFDRLFSFHQPPPPPPPDDDANIFSFLDDHKNALKSAQDRDNPLIVLDDVLQSCVKQSLVEVSERIHSAYRKLKKMHASLCLDHLNLQKEYEIIRKDHALIDNNHMKLLDEFDELKKKCDELEKLNDEIERDGKTLIDKNIHREHLRNIEIMGLKHMNSYFERKWKEFEENRKIPALV